MNPEDLTESGEHCLRRLNELYELNMQPGHLATAIGTVVEMHCTRTLGYLISESSVLETPMGVAMFEKLEKDLNQSWTSRSGWLKRGFGLTYTGVTQTQNFDILVELRNSVVHGDGSLSPHQESDGTVKTIKLRSDIKRVLDAELHGRLNFGPESSKKMIQVARAFVLHFDTQFLSAYPNARRF